MKTKSKLDPCKLDSEAVLLAAGVKRPMWQPNGNWSYIDVIGSHFFPDNQPPVFMTSMVAGCNVIESMSWGTN